MVHGCEEYLSGSAFHGFTGPREEEAVGDARASMGGDMPLSVVATACVDGHDHKLAPVSACDCADEPGVAYGGTVDCYLVGSGVEQCGSVVGR